MSWGLLRAMGRERPAEPPRKASLGQRGPKACDGYAHSDYAGGFTERVKIAVGMLFSANLPLLSVSSRMSRRTKPARSCPPICSSSVCENT